MSYLVNAGGIRIADAESTVTIALSAGESAAVRRAVEGLASDLTDVCGCRTTIVEDATMATIVVGTLGKSSAVADAVSARAIDVDELHAGDGSLLWEAFTLQTAESTLYIVGTSRRGTMYGVYDLCEAMGVSPWRWFADVPVRTREHVTLPLGKIISDHPSVRYRGIFINDEEELNHWAKLHTEDGTIGPGTYVRIFELLLRLKGNYIWPAMHVNFFNENPENGRLADEMGIVVGTSHCDMLLRSNQNEWEPWLGQQQDPVEYDYSIPGRNRAMLQEYWRGSVEQNREYEASWTLGMRGIHDTGFVTSTIDEDGKLSENEKLRERVRLLGQVITDQRSLLSETMGLKSEGRPLQIFVPYKEVLPLYDAGLEVPEDVTIIWVDDNFGYVRRYPSDEELNRVGGHGLYYHSSYWAPPPLSYLFISSIPLVHMRNELRKSWDHGIRTLWVDNVGSIKPLEQEVEFFLRYAWEVGKETTTADIPSYLVNWVDRKFSDGHGSAVAELLQEFAQVTNVRKLEHLSSRAFSQTAYGDEGARRLDRLRTIYESVVRIQEALPEAEQDGFFQLVSMKMHASYLINAQFYYADRSTLAYEQGKNQAADHYLAVSRRFDDHKRAMVHFYNDVMSDGKWKAILTPELFPPPVTSLFPSARPALRIGDPHLGVVAWGDACSVDHPRLIFSATGTQSKWVEVFNSGAGELDVSINASEGIMVSEKQFMVGTERRVQVWVPELDAVTNGAGQLMISSSTDGRQVTVHVDVDKNSLASSDTPRHVEDDGFVSISANDFDELHNEDEAQWIVVPRLGRGENDLVQAVGSIDASERTVRPDSPWMGYDVHLKNSGAFLLEIHRYLSLNALGRIRVGVSVDDSPAIVVESPTTDEWRGVWFDAVMQGVEKLYLRLPYLEAGAHRLRVHVVDQHVAFFKLVVYTAPRVESSLGPRPSSEALRCHSDPAPGSVDFSLLEIVRRDVYRTGLEELDPHDVVYVRPAFWLGETNFRRNETVSQGQLGHPRYVPEADGTKDVLAQFPPGPAAEHEGRIAIEFEHSMLDTVDAYLTPSLDEPQIGWTHTEAETDGRTGLAMHVDQRDRVWSDPLKAPGIHRRIRVTAGGTFHVWLLTKFNSQSEDACDIALDGVPQPISEHFSGGNLFMFGLKQVWVWVLLSNLHIPAGEHVFTLYARKSGMRVDRAYLTMGEELPPPDLAWGV